MYIQRHPLSSHCYFETATDAWIVVASYPGLLDPAFVAFNTNAAWDRSQESPISPGIRYQASCVRTVMPSEHEANRVWVSLHQWHECACLLQAASRQPIVSIIFAEFATMMKCSACNRIHPNTYPALQRSAHTLICRKLAAIFLHGQWNHNSKFTTWRMYKTEFTKQESDLKEIKYNQSISRYIQPNIKLISYLHH